MLLADRQRAFAAALLDPAASVPAGIVGPDGKPSARRFAVYRNNVAVGLIEALRTAFPATCRLVGTDFFTAMAREFALRSPPVSPVMHDYGAAFPDFISIFEPASSLPYLPDVAHIERAYVEAYHALEAKPVEPSEFAAIPAEQAGALRLLLHPSVRIVRSRFPALTIWRMNVGDGVPAPVDVAFGGEDALIVRPDAEVEVRAVPPGGAAFVAELADGRTLEQATLAAFEEAASFDLAGNLAALIGAGLFITCRLHNELPADHPIFRGLGADRRG